MSVVVITGCSSGFGLETALAFARRGDTTYATMRNLARSGDLVERAKAEGLSIELLSLDVDDDASAATAVAEVEQHHGAIDILVNNAGIDYSGSVETIDFDEARAVMETNFWGPVRTIRAALPAMRAKGGAVIINVSSVSGRLRGTPFYGWYSASKHALNALSEALSIELDRFDVRVACIEPGFFKTEIIGKAAAREVDGSDPYAADRAWVGEFFEKSLNDAGGDPADVAGAIVSTAYDPEAPLHNLIGEDATALVDLVAQTGTLEAWVPMALSLVATVAGPRPE